jgi:hypothetical protein
VVLTKRRPHVGPVHSGRYATHPDSPDTNSRATGGCIGRLDSLRTIRSREWWARRKPSTTLSPHVITQPNDDIQPAASRP